ncbi:MAG TPA: hypothetical protein VGG14_18160 [Candidatus Sulfotelmatobacter sp.]
MELAYISAQNWEKSWYKSGVAKKSGFSFSLFIFLILIVASPMPAHAYGDPSGGMLFQIITPILALLWGTWLIFAQKIHRWFQKVTGKDLTSTTEPLEAEHSDALTQEIEQTGVQK